MPDTNTTSRPEQMTETLRSWQGIERASMDVCARVMEDSPNPLIRMIMEIIRHDSMMHHRVQQFLIDSLTVQDVAVSREDVAAVWDRLEEHDRQEKQTIAMAAQLRDNAWSPLHRELLDYLIVDERKHERLLGLLEEIKAGMTLASGA